MTFSAISAIFSGELQASVAKPRTAAVKILTMFFISCYKIKLVDNSKFEIAESAHSRNFGAKIAIFLYF
jgi:hypothetical protein